MKFGDEEWFAMLNERCNFPNVFAFYVGSNKTVTSKLIETKGTVPNIQYKRLDPPIFSHEHTALADVKWCETPQDYYETAKTLMDVWGIEPKEYEKSA